jgi:hypothetical protein
MPLQYRIAAVGRALFPELAADVLGLMERALPSSPGDEDEGELRTGAESTSRVSPSVFSSLGDRAAARNNEI